MNFCILYNRKSAGGRKSKFIKKIYEGIKKNHQIVLFETENELEASNIIKNVEINKYDRLILAGGDGSVSFAVSELLKNNFNPPKDFALGYIPAGTANILQAELNMKKKVSHIVKTLTSNKIQKANLVKINDKYFLLEVVKTEEIIKKFEDKEVKNKIILSLKNQTKRELISQIISKINSKSFLKSDFNKLSKDENVKIQQISIKNLNDDKILNKEIISQIYNYPEKSIIVVHDMELSKNFLVYIDLIQDVKINKKSDKYSKYLNLSKIRITTGLFNTYDNYIKQKYNIDINYKALDTIKNYSN